MKEMHGLSDDCIDFLKTNVNTEIRLKIKFGDISRVSFFSIDELALDYQILSTYEYFLNYGEPGSDPKVTYHIPSISLVKEDLDGNYRSEGLLVWLPNCRMFGTADIDHEVLYVFPDSPWSKIRLNLAECINTQWSPNSSLSVLLRPWIDQGFNVNFKDFIQHY